MIILFPGIFAKGTEWRWVFDFTALSSAFGQISVAGDMAVFSRGTGGMGAKGGFLFTLELAPFVTPSLGIISITERLGGLCTAQQLMTPVLCPLLGIPGICLLALIADLQSTDTAAGMTKEMTEEGIITEQERAIFICWQTNDSACITDYLSSDAALFTIATVPVITSLAMIPVFKFAGANLLRVWITQPENHHMQQEA